METLHEKFLAACEYFMLLEEYDGRIQKSKKELVDSEAKYKKELLKIERSTGKSALKGNLIRIGVFAGAVIAIAICVYIIIAIITAATGGDVGDFFGTAYIMTALLAYVWVPIGAVTAAICLILCITHTNKVRKSNEPLIKAAREKWIAENAVKLDDVKKKHQDLIQTKDKLICANYKLVEFLPPDYRLPYPVFCMEQLVRNGRAETLKEVINLFEELMHRERLEANSARMLEQTENLRRQLAAWRAENNAQMSAINHNLAVHTIVNGVQMSTLNRNIKNINDKLD